MTWGTLSCGHDLLVTDPDMDVAGSEYCSKCGGYFGFISFSSCGPSEDSDAR